MDIIADLLQWFKNFFDKNTSGSNIGNKNISNKNYLNNYTKHLLENLRKEKYTHLL